MKQPKLTPAEIEATLAQFSGSETYYENPVTKACGLVYTEGVKAMAEFCSAFWLIDLICSYQARCRKDPMLREIQFWTLTVNGTPDGAHFEPATVVCERDSGDIAFQQTIEGTDFPLRAIEIWVGNGVMYLPSEH